MSWEHPQITVSKTGAHPGRRLKFPGLVAQLWFSPEAAAAKPLIFPLNDDDPAALSPSKWEARRDTKKCSRGTRVNQTSCRSLVRSLVICLGCTCGREGPSCTWKCLPGMDHAPIKKRCASPGRRLELPGPIAQPPCCWGWHHGYRFDGSRSWPS